MPTTGKRRIMVKFESVPGCEPSVATKSSAGADLVARKYTMISGGDVVLIPTGVKISEVPQELMDNYYLSLHIRSSTAYKKGLLLANGVGVIDLDYPDEIQVLVKNPTKYVIEIEKGERIAQLILLQHFTNLLGVEAKDVERVGGIGSTNVRK